MDRGGAVDGVMEHCWGGQVINIQGFWIPSWGHRTLKPSPSWGASVSESAVPSLPRTPQRLCPSASSVPGWGPGGGKRGGAGAESRDWTINPPLSLT